MIGGLILVVGIRIERDTQLESNWNLITVGGVTILKGGDHLF